MDCSYVRQLRRFVLRVSQAPDQNRVTCFVISALACTRARPAATLALLSHMLMNGFFFSHGLATGALPAEIFECKRSSGAKGLIQTATTGDGTGAKQVVYRSSPGRQSDDCGYSRSRLISIASQAKCRSPARHGSGRRHRSAPRSPHGVILCRARQTTLPVLLVLLSADSKGQQGMGFLHGGEFDLQVEWSSPGRGNPWLAPLAWSSPRW
jgi:hypothetical protein